MVNTEHYLFLWDWLACLEKEAMWFLKPLPVQLLCWPVVINTILPSSLFPIAACAFRYNGLSFVYLIYLLLIPLFSEPTKATMQGKRLCDAAAQLHDLVMLLDSLGLSFFREEAIIWAAGVGVGPAL